MNFLRGLQQRVFCRCRYWACLSAFVLFSVAFPVAARGQTATNERSQQQDLSKPNIIYVMLDDAGYADFGAFGSKHIATPYFDSLCREGMRFTNHYAGSAVCAPTRCVLMTGLSTGHCRRRDNTATSNLNDFPGRPLVFLEDEDLTVAETLQDAGYVTGGIGKWGLGNSGTSGSPDKQGFDHFYGYLDQVHAHNYYSDWLWKNGNREELKGNQGGKKATYTHDLFEEDALRFVREHKNDRFFLYLPFTLPHGDYVIPHKEPAYQRYADKDWSQKVKNYAGMVTRADESVGKIMKLLKELDIDDNTIVFYTSDHGPNPPFARSLGSAGPFRGIKRQLTEGGLRSAMAVRWPNVIPANSKSDFVWSMVDVFPTFCELAQHEIPEHLDGTSVLPTLVGKTQKPISHHYWEIHHPFQQAVRMGPWKAIRYGTKEPLRLFDITKDPMEKTDLSDQFPDVVKQIETIMTTDRTESRHYQSVEHPKKKARTK